MLEMSAYDKNSIVGEELFDEIFSSTDKVARTRMILACQARAKELGVKGVFDSLISAYKSNQTSSFNPGSRMTDFRIPDDPRYKNMKCGSWIANNNGIVSYNVMGMELRASYQPVLPIERLENIETGEEQIVLAFTETTDGKKLLLQKMLFQVVAK